MRYKGNAKGNIPHYPKPSMLIAYHLAEDTEETILLDILDADGEVIRAYTSEKTAKDSKEQKEPDMATGFYPRGSDISLSKKAGGHRVRWDLRMTGPWHKDEKRSGKNGPMAAPGEYSVRLTIDEQVLEQKVILLADPRVIETGLKVADIQAQTDLRTSVRDLLTKARKMEATLKSRKKDLRKQLEEAKDKKVLSKKIQAIDELLNKISTPEGRYMQPQLVAQLSYLYSMLGRADQKPGKDAYERFEELKQWMDIVQPMWDKLFETK